MRTFGTALLDLGLAFDVELGFPRALVYAQRFGRLAASSAGKEARNRSEKTTQRHANEKSGQGCAPH